jgi:uncharacterized alpha-E superfamily protein
VISRVAESCFWLNRYVERVDVLSRMLQVNLAFQLDVSLPDAERWRPLVVVSGQAQDFLARTPEDELDDPERVQEYLTWSDENPSSLYSSLRGARENARTIRETISLEMWETLNDLWVWMGDRRARRLYASDRHSFYGHLRNQCMLFHGVTQETMLHEDPFEFMRLGTALERAGQTARVLDVKYHSVGPTDAESETPEEVAEWLAVLRFCSGVEPFLKREDRSLSGRDVAEFLLFDPAFPRSVLHNLERARHFLSLVRPPEPTSVGARTQARLLETLEQLARMGIDTVLAEGLHEVLTWIVDSAAEICASVYEDFFDPKFPGARAPGRPSQLQSQVAGSQRQEQAG